MIRKPADWLDEGAAVRTAVATESGSVLRRGGQFAVGMVFYSVALFWGYAAYNIGPGNLPTFIGASAMAAFMYLVGRRAFMKALATSG